MTIDDTYEGYFKVNLLPANLFLMNNWAWETSYVNKPRKKKLTGSPLTQKTPFSCKKANRNNNVKSKQSELDGRHQDCDP